MTYQVGDAFSLQLDEGQEEHASRRGRGRPIRRRSLRRRRGTEEEAAVADGQQVVQPEVSESSDREPEPLADTDLAVVPIDPREVLWAVERMIEL